MNYREYAEFAERIEAPEKTVFKPAFLWTHMDRMPAGLVSCGDENLTTVKIPEKVKNRYGNTVSVVAVSRNAFAGNVKITDIILPPAFERIPDGAFSGCTNLRNITIPGRVRKIGEKTFDGCVSLENIYYEGTPEEWKKIKVVFWKYEIEFGDLIPGTPVEEISSERYTAVPGNGALLRAVIHCHCDPGKIYRN